MSTEAAEAVAAMILERQQARTSEYAQRRSARVGFRETFKRRRDAGLRRRHAAKLARNRKPGMLI
jgi:hypothetical protein